MGAILISRLDRHAPRLVHWAHKSVDDTHKFVHDAPSRFLAPHSYVPLSQRKVPHASISVPQAQSEMTSTVIDVGISKTVRLHTRPQSQGNIYVNSLGPGSSLCVKT